MLELRRRCLVLLHGALAVTAATRAERRALVVAMHEQHREDGLFHYFAHGGLCGLLVRTHRSAVRGSRVSLVAVRSLQEAIHHTLHGAAFAYLPAALEEPLEHTVAVYARNEHIRRTWLRHWAETGEALTRETWKLATAERREKQRQQRRNTAERQERLAQAGWPL